MRGIANLVARVVGHITGPVGMREITIPVLLLWGDADPISPVAVGRRLAELFPSAELIVFAGGTHDLVAERAGEVTPHIDRHLAKTAPIPSASGSS